VERDFLIRTIKVTFVYTSNICELGLQVDVPSQTVSQKTVMTTVACLISRHQLQQQHRQLASVR